MSGAYQVGLIGLPLGHSRSPTMQQAAFDALGIPARYELWEAAPGELAARIAALRGPGVLGANVTIPYKTAVLPLLDELTDSARLAGAVNTIVSERDPAGDVHLVGHNTDVAGLRRALDEASAWQAGRRVLLLGAGGAARAVLAVARLEGAAVTVAARRVEAGREAIAAMSSTPGGPADASAPKGVPPQSPPTQAGTEPSQISSPQDAPDKVIALDDTSHLAAALAETALLVNATPVGMSDPGAAPIPLDLLARLPEDAFVFDLVYSPPETALVRAARARGLRASGGLPMLLYQGAEAFTLWTGQVAPIEVMRAALEADG